MSERECEGPTVRISRRALLQLIGASAAAAAGSLRFERVAFAQPGGWFAASSGARVSFPKDAIIRTVLQDIVPDRMPAGSTQIHEHLGGQFAAPRPIGASEIPPGPYSAPTEREYVDMMADELKMSKADGLACLVDAAAAGRRDDRTVENLKQIATRSGVLIVLGGGYYQDLALNARYPAEITRMPEGELEEQLVRDAASQRWGAFGEIASSQPMQPEERKLLRAIGKAHRRTNLPIFTHTPHEGCPECAVEQLDVFESTGVDPRRVCIGHLATIKPAAEAAAATAKALAKRGAFVGFDTV